MNILKRYSLFTFFLLIISITAHCRNDLQPLKGCYEFTEQYPYYVGNSTKVANPPGASIDLINHVAQSMNIRVQYERMPWDSCKKKLQLGLVDLIFNASFSPDRLVLGVYPMKSEDTPDTSRRLTTLTYSFYALANTHIKWDGVKLLGVDDVGAPKGYSIVETLKKMGLNVEESKSSYNDFNKLISGRYKVTATLATTGDNLLKLHPDEFKNVVKVYPPIVTKPYYMMFSHKFYEKNILFCESFWSKLGEAREKLLPSLLNSYHEVAMKDEHK